MCGKMIWVLGSYHPGAQRGARAVRRRRAAAAHHVVCLAAAPMAGVNALATICGWWHMQKLLPDGDEGIKALGVVRARAAISA